MSEGYFGGIDVGASATKAVIVDAAGEVVGRSTVDSGMDFVAASQAAYESCLDDAGCSAEQVARVVASGYGRKNVPVAQGTKTEIACHAKGAHHSFSEAMTIVDIGGQDNKIIKVGATGELLDFKMNRKCAAGTGAFLEEIARRVGLPLEEMNDLARQSTERIELGSFCTVFSATEILALIRRGAQVPDIVNGAFRSVVKRITEMDALTDKVVATGGVVAHNPIVTELLGVSIGRPVVSPPEPQLTGALGAALFALDKSA